MDATDSADTLGRRFSETGKCLLVWHADGTVSKELTKHIDLDPEVRSRFAYELRINQMFATIPPPIPFARLIAAERRDEVMRFRAVDGDALGLKFPMALRWEDLVALSDLAARLEEYRPTESWIRRYDTRGEIRRRLREGVIDEDEFAVVDRVIRTGECEFSFAHGDFTPRNALSSPTGPVLIDWEFAGWYPVEYDRAFLWMILIELPEARAFLENVIRDDRRQSFWMCAYLIHLMHLGMWSKRQQKSPYLPKHLETKKRTLLEFLRASEC